MSFKAIISLKSLFLIIASLALIMAKMTVSNEYIQFLLL